MALKALLFDMDGTMIDSDPIHVAVFIEFLAVFGIRLTEAEYKANMHGRQNVDIFREILPDADPHALDKAKEAAYRTRLGPETGPMPGLRDVLAHAERQGLRTAVVTNACRENVDKVLAVFGMETRFDFVSLGDDCPLGKPHPQAYLNALSALGVGAHEALAFEDSPSGIRAATGAGIPTVGMASTLPPDQLTALGALFAIPDFTDPALLRHLDMLQGATS
jgi:HAD superfamily hydrolase (TIGR01509 family)